MRRGRSRKLRTLAGESRARSVARGVSTALPVGPNGQHAACHAIDCRPGAALQPERSTQVLPRFTDGNFEAAFLNRRGRSEYMASFPLFVVTAEIGLRGTFAYALSVAQGKR